MSSTTVAIGIYLGTTNSCVGVFQNEMTKIIVNDHGQRVTPSMVAFTDTELLIGDAAKKQAARNPENTVFGVKRLIGRCFDDPVVQENMKLWPFEVVNDGNGKPVIQVKFKGETKRFTPEEITSMLLGKMKETAEAYLGTTVTNAVIGVPVFYSNDQRQATKDAASLAGLNVLHIISEPALAAIAYGIGKNTKEAKNVLVFHLGGRTLNVSVLKVDDGVFEWKVSSGSDHFGGEKFDNRLVEHVVKEYQSQHQKDISTSKRALLLLRTACEQAKRVLSFTSKTVIEVDALFEKTNLRASFTRGDFEEICLDLVCLALEPVKQAIEIAGLTESQINEIVLVGGSTRIPLVQALLREHFSGKKLNMAINPEETVAYGAAVQAAIINGNHTSLPLLKSVYLPNATSLSLGLRTCDGAMKTVIERGTVFPLRKTVRLFTITDNSSQIRFQVYEGERALAKNNYYLGELTLSHIPLTLLGKTQIDITFEIDDSSSLEVTAQVVSTGQKSCITILENDWHLSTEMAELLVSEAKQYRLEDGLHRERSSVFNALLEQTYQIKRTLATENYLEVAEQRRAMEKVENTLAWLKSNAQAKKKELEKKRAKLEAVCKPVIEKLEKLKCDKLMPN
ncbi:Heat shock 70 kDa protein 1A [Tyrophagus putrescentiae]|nr:Heat shock 70 kDa protein 1A [Tyrophagus putrescentiae]